MIDITDTILIAITVAYILSLVDFVSKFVVACIKMKKLETEIKPHEKGLDKVPLTERIRILRIMEEIKEMFPTYVEAIRLGFLTAGYLVSCLVFLSQGIVPVLSVVALLSVVSIILEQYFITKTEKIVALFSQIK